MKAKKLLSIILASSMTLCAASAVQGAGEDVKVFLDDKEIGFEAPPRIINDFTLVPFRAIFEAFGYSVDWDGATQTVTGVKGDIKLDMVIGKSEATLTNTADTNTETAVKTVAFDVPAQIIDDFTFVPLRALGEMSNYKVDWDGEARKVLITSPSEIMTGPGPAMPETTPDPATQTGPGPSSPAQDAPLDENGQPTLPPSQDPQAQPATPDNPPSVSDNTALPITYDDTNERESHSLRDFQLLTAQKNAEGKYDITFSLKTFFEGGGGVVTALFSCLDADGNVIDTFGDSYNCIDYAWTPHEGKATISGDTVKIVFNLN